MGADTLKRGASSARVQGLRAYEIRLESVGKTSIEGDSCQAFYPTP